MANGFNPFNIFARVREKQGLQQDLLALQQFQQQQQLAPFTQLPAGIAGPSIPLQPQLPKAQSKVGANLFANLLLQQHAQQANLMQGLANQNVPFTLAPGAGRFDAQGNLIAQQPATTSRAGSFQQIQDPKTGKQVNALVDPISGDIIRNFGSVEEGLTRKDKAQVAVAQAKEFRADSRIKNLNIIERSERGMEAALKAATSPNVKSRIASDQALGVLFQKMLDPESVVRESEFARTPEGAAAVNRLLAIAPQLKVGGLKLLNEDRQALVNMARKLLVEAKITANRAFDEFNLRADELGLNKNVVFGGAKKFNITEPVPVTLPEGLTEIDKRIAELEAKARQ